MYFVVIFCILIAVSAGQRPAPIPGLPTYHQKAGADPKHCCAPAQYTHGLIGNIARLYLGELFTIFGRCRGAYDSINKLIAGETVLDFSNGTEDTIKMIFDYNKLKGYYITKVKGVVDCQKFEITHPDFPYNCIPDDAVFIGSNTLGDRALVSDQWYINANISSAESAHIVYSIKGEGCVDLGSSQRVFDSKTGDEIRTESTTWYDFKLGIEDPGRWFKPPSECQGAKVTKIPDQLRHSPLYGGKVTLFD